MLTPSRFNVRSVTAAGVVYANTRSGGVYLVDEAADAFLQGASGREGVDLGALVSCGLAVLDRDGELADLRHDYEQARDDDSLALTIAPTVACNLRCSYCFETEHPNRVQTSAEADAIVRLVRREFASRDVSRLDVTWFGGEPLLHLAGIERLSRDLIRASTFAGVPYAATIVTNGTRLDRATAGRLRSWRVLRAQITLDGGQRTHDRLRVDAAGRGTYDRVVAGIVASVGLLEIDLRVHADRRTARSIPAMIDDLAGRDLQRVHLGFARIEPPGVFTDAGPVDNRFLTGREFASMEVEWLEQARRAGFAVRRPIATGEPTLPCMAVSSRHMAIEPGGRVHRCYADVAGDRLDGVLEADGSLLLHDDERRWHDYLPFDLGCADCAVLPLCMGGCPKARVDGALRPSFDHTDRSTFKERHVCHPRRFNLADLLARDLVR